MDILNDIDSALRADQAKALWQKYGSAAVTALLAVLVLAALYQVYDGWRHKRDAALTDKLIATLQQGEKAGLAGFAKTATGTHKMIAAFVAAGREADTTKRAALLQAIANDAGAPRDFRDLALIMTLRATQAQNKGDAEQQAQKLLRIIGDKRAAFADLARLDLSSLQARHLGDLKAARDTLAPVLKAENVPPELLGQAQALDHVYALDQVKK